MKREKSEILKTSARSRSIIQSRIITRRVVHVSSRKPFMIDQTQTTVDLFQLLQRSYSYCQERWQQLLAINDSTL